MQVGVRPLNPEVFFKKLRKPLDDRFLLFRAVAAAKAGDGWEDLVNIRAGRFERTVAERVGDEALRFCGLQLFFCDDLLQLLLLLLLHITLPVAVNIRCGVDRTNKAVNQVFFAAQLDAGIDRPVDGSQDALVLAVRFMVLHDKHQNVVNVDLHLPDELDLEGNIIVDILFVPVCFRAIRLIKVEIHALVILKIPLRQDFSACKLVKRAEDLFEPQDIAVELDEILLLLLANDWLAERKLA